MPWLTAKLSNWQSFVFSKVPECHICFYVTLNQTTVFLHLCCHQSHAKFKPVDILWEVFRHNTTRQIWGIWKLRPAYSPETPNLGQNRWCFVPCDLEIWWMTLENNRASLLCCFKLCATFHSHWWIQTGVTVRKRPNLGQIRRFLEPCDLEIWCMTLKNNRAPLLCYFKLYASFRSHQWIQAGVTVRKRPIWVKINDFFSRVTLQFDVWPCKKNRAPLLCYFKLCASFCSHWWFQTRVTVRKRPIWVKFDDF